MSDFVAFEEDIDSGMEYLEHFGILGMKHGKRNGPPYPLGSGDHSAGEKAAAKAAGVSVGSDSGKGSIENVKSKRSKSVKKPMTEEERREAALEAYRKGDKKKLSKYMDTMTTEELADAKRRAELKEAFDKKEDKPSKEDIAKREAINSGDIEKVKEYETKMTASELQEAMNKVKLHQELNHVDPPPTAFERIQSVSQKLGTFKEAAEKTIAAYNTVATVMNSLNPDSDTKWPVIDKDNNNPAVKEIAKDVKKEIKETAKEKADKEAEAYYEQKRAQYDADKKFEKYKEKAEEKERKKAEKESKGKEKPETKEEPKPESNKGHEYIKKEGEGEDAVYTYKEDTSNRKYTPQRPPEIAKSVFKSKVSDSDVSYDDIIPESYKSQMRETAFNKSMAEFDYEDLYDYAMRHSEV
jgi:hypothetical protein